MDYSPTVPVGDRLDRLLAGAVYPRAVVVASPRDPDRIAIFGSRHFDNLRDGARYVKLKVDHILNDDCLAGLARLPDGAVDLAFADPPFNIGYDYDVYHDRHEADDYLTWCRRWIGELYRVLKADGTFWVAIGDEFAAELKILAQREIGFTCRSWVVWYYTFGVNCTKKFSRSHAHLFHFVKDPKRFTFNDTQVRVPSARQLVYGDGRANPNGRLPDDTWMIPPRAADHNGASTYFLRPQDLPDSFQPEEDTWYFPRVAGTFKQRAGWHGCQMPEQLLGRIIRACSNPGELVLDPFGGSGTTLAVAKKLDRRFIGFELSAQYAKKIEKRLAAIEIGDPLDGAPEPLVSAPSTANGISLKEREQNRRRTGRKKRSAIRTQKRLL
jgi:site-specific DNA-methyltransferase (adenine-specific)